MATPVDVATKMLQQMEVKTAGVLGSGNDKASEIWKPFEDDNSHLANAIRLIPAMYPKTTTQWLEIVKGIFRDNPKISDANKLRIILRQAVENGYRTISIKCGMLLTNINKYGSAHEALAEFWEWAERTFPASWHAKVNQFEAFIKSHKIGATMSPVDAIKYALYEAELGWEDVERNEKVQNMVVYVLRRDVTYLSVEDLVERNARAWGHMLIEEWTKNAKSEYHRELGDFRFWEEIQNQKNQGRRRRR